MDNKFRLDLAGIPKELLLILELLKRDEYAPLNEPQLLIDIDWKLFINLVNHHRLYPSLYRKLKLVENGLIPEYVIESIEQSYKQNTFQMLLLSAEMEQVSKLFNEEKIRSLFLKGPMLAHELYGDVSLRTSSDLDILIPLNKLENAERLLENLGYEKDDYIQTVLNDWKWRHHHVTYIHPQKRMKLEIHWRLNPGPSKEPNFEQLWERKNRSSLTSYPVYLLGKEDLFLLLVSHGARHGWSRLRWLLDIKELVKQDLDWDKVRQLVKTYHFQQEGGQSLILSSQLLDSKISNKMTPLISKKKPGEVAQKATFYFRQRVSLHNNPVPKEIAVYHKRYLFSLMSFQQKIVFILTFLHPYPEDAQTLSLPKKFHFLYFPLRPFLWAWRKTKKDALS
ncbi:nucleotidyltransferase domain-containing protein [Aquibacillus saliphilus]|uniref:nucleotidyltransferase domain-containing protein n=1 Tax=Aquibacillus saliphilus TaxID=1909422 RepID=UPI001CF08A0E|nr:nucleotidyltransferase family protein [Aquibacillus saliphilus]